MKRLSIFVFILTVVSIGCTTSIESVNGEFVLNQSEITLKELASEVGDSKLSPRCIEEDGALRLVEHADWTSGFFSGCLWMQYEYTKDEYWKNLAEKHTQILEPEKFNGTTHDMGFKMYCSYGNGYRLTNNEEYKNILIQSAQTLATRYNPIIGCLKSWDHNTDKWQFPVIVDNMINLELLFWATKATKDSSYYNIAVSHALTTLTNHFRENNSSYHVVDYDTLTGEVLHKHTHQGEAHESEWARGQGWGLYGYTMCYREAGDERFLDQAIKIADYLMNHKNLPQDGIPYWDLLASDIPKAPRDASAAAVICSGLYELSTYANDKSTVYKEMADKIFASLASDKYLISDDKPNGFLLGQSVGNMPKNDEVSTSIIYADYYFMEAALRKKNIEKE